MQLRPATPADVTMVGDIDATIEATRYLHLDRTGQGFAMHWRLEERPLREKLVRGNPLAEDHAFTLRQIAGGADEGLAVVAEHDGVLVALLLSQPDPVRQVLRVLDVRVDYDHRRQGLATALLFQAVNHARDLGLRAVATESTTANLPACQLLAKTGFELAGVDERRNTNHDLVKEAVTLFWYAPLD
ncbi:MAG TPA: GNAT family N-acetyltransferase [Tepidisphaeraceae bacterium]|nr:GNAT family N-acetyltransferase [Tepidisphaeraceae bacterium]